MPFDPEIHNIKQILIRCGRALREAKGLPLENDITILYREASMALGIPLIETTTKSANHLPSPAEMKDAEGKFIVPNKPCSKCGKPAFLTSICPSCEASEGGKFKSGYTCFDRACGFVNEKTEEFISQRFKRMGVEIPQGPKQSLGIRTVTDHGIK